MTQVCAFCGATPSFPHRRRPLAWQDVAGRQVCDDDCAEKEQARQAAEQVELVHTEVDGWWGLAPDGRFFGPSETREDLLWDMAW